MPSYFLFILLSQNQYCSSTSLYSIMSESIYSENNIKEAYNHLLASCYRIDPSTGNAINPNANTRSGHRLDATQSLHETSSRLADGKALLNDAIVTLCDISSTKISSKNAASVIKNSIMPLLDIAVSCTRDAANMVSPLPVAQCSSGHKREDMRRARESAQMNPKKEAKLARVNDFIKSKPTASQPSQAVRPGTRLLPS